MASLRCGRVIFTMLAICGLLPLPNWARSFSEEPHDTAVQRGSTAVLRCSVDDIGTATIAWWNDDQRRFISHNRDMKRENLDADQLQRYSILTGDPSLGEFNLQIRNFTDSDAATYKCHIFASSARESFFKFSQNAALTVAPYDPLCYVDSKSPIPMVGDTVNLVCESRNPGFGGDLIWIYAARTFLTGNTSRSPVVRTVVQRVLKATDYDARFMCLEREFQESRTCFLIPLRQFIPVLIQTANAQPQVGDTLTYRCVANKDLTPLSYSWYVDGVNAASAGEELTIAGEELIIGPVNASHNGSLIECAVKHYSGFKGNDSITLHIQPIRGGTRTSTPQTTGLTRSKLTAEVVFLDTDVSPVLESSSPDSAILLDQLDKSTTQGDGWNGLFMPFVICASVVGILLTTVIVLLTVFLSRQRASNRRVTDAGKSKEGARGPPSDCVPLDLVAHRNGNVDDSPSISIGTLKGFKNPAGCGSVDTFELDLDPDSQPEYYTLEHNYCEATARKPGLTYSCEDNQDSGFDGIEVSETITPDSALAARNRKFSFGSSPPPPVPSSPAQPHTPMVVPPEFEGNDAEVESLVAAYAVTDVARSSPPDTTRVIARGGSLKRPLPARPNESGYRAPSVVFANERPFCRFGSMKSLDEPAVGALARSNSLKRPLPATPREGTTRVLHTPDPYRYPISLFTRIPPFLTSEPTPTTPETSTKTDPPVETEKPHKKQVPQKYTKLTAPLERLSAATSVSEGDYAEIDTDQEATETDSLISDSSTRGNNAAVPGENETQSTVDLEELAGTAGSKDAGLPKNGFENDYDVVADSGEEINSDQVNQSGSPALNPKSDHEYFSTNGDSVMLAEFQDGNTEVADEPFITPKFPKYAKVKKIKSEELMEIEANKNEEHVARVGDTSLKTPCIMDIPLAGENLKTDSDGICQEMALLQNAELPYALVK